MQKAMNSAMTTQDGWVTADKPTSGLANIGLHRRHKCGRHKRRRRLSRGVVLMRKSRVKIRAGKPVPQWTIPEAELQLQLAEGRKQVADYPSTLKLLGVPDSLLPEVTSIPDTLPEAFFVDQAAYMRELWCPPRKYRLRRSQRDFSSDDWNRFLDAFERLAGFGLFDDLLWEGPSLDDFVDIHVRAFDPNDHVAMGWGAHTMAGHNGRNFLTWHREYLVKFEAALMAVNPLVTIPFWDWVHDPEIPEPLSDVFNNWHRFHVIHDPDFNPNNMPSAESVNAVLDQTTYDSFRLQLEGAGVIISNHNLVHRLVGGTMATGEAPAHPLFWLHHAFVDKLWADWQVSHDPGGNPDNISEVLMPPPIMTRTVAGVVSTRNLGYVYA